MVIRVEPPPKKVDALSGATHINKVIQPTVKPADSPQPLPAEQTETPQATAPVAAPVETPPAPPVAPVIGCGSDPNMAYIYQHESGCCTTKWQGEHECLSYHGVPSDYSGLGYGLCQSTPPSKMATSGADWGTSWDIQNDWCVGYAVSRYGNTYNAYLFWVNHSWW